mmetsp:Transcript_11535/g.27666  ORF Transcript_11535/g.27666 Transcript_11535/m.27666 type:complete len:254 (-) Transcript_11535:129-890(-)
MSEASVGSAPLTCSNGGCGFPRQKFDSVHVALRSIEMRVVFGSSCLSSGISALCESTRSRSFAESPAMLPRAHTACSRTSSLGELRSCTNMGTAPRSTQTCVCSEVPDAMLVNAHAASNCRVGRCHLERNSTKRGTTPALITCWMGGLRSMESSLRNSRVASSCVWSSGAYSAWVISGSLATSSCEASAPPRASPPPESPTLRRRFSFSSVFCLRSSTVLRTRCMRASWALVLDLTERGCCLDDILRNFLCCN